MFIETSALLAMLLDEPEAERMTAAVLTAGTRVTGAPNVLEAFIVMSSRVGASGGVALDALLERLGIEVVPMTRETTDRARDAFVRFGKRIGRPPVLNFGDCMSYALARERGEPLLFKGDDFSVTDIDAVDF